MSNELLKYALDNGMINLSYVQEQIEMARREDLLKKHPYNIWKGSDGYWHTYIPDKNKGRIPKKKKDRRAIEDDVVEYWRSESENPTVVEVFEEWNNRRLQLQKISQATHLRNTQIFNRHYETFGKRKIKSVEAEDVGEFLEEQIPEYQLTAKAFSNLKTITRGLFKRAKKRKLVDFNIEDVFSDLDTSEYDFKKVIKEDYEEVFNEEEMPVIVEHLQKNIDIVNLCILLMFVTGVRVGEAVSLKHEDFIENTFKIRRTETRYFDDTVRRYVCVVKDFPKSQAGVRTVIIPKDYSWLISSMKRYNPFSEYIFMKNGRRLTTQVVRMRLRRICDNLKIYPKSPHKIRKTYGTILLDNHIDNKLIIGQMGHTDISCTENHYHRNRRSVEKKTEILSRIPEFKGNENDVDYFMPKSNQK